MIHYVIQNIAGWWLSHPSEKYESQMGWWHCQYKEKHKSCSKELTSKGSLRNLTWRYLRRNAPFLVIVDVNNGSIQNIQTVNSLFKTQSSFIRFIMVQLLVVQLLIMDVFIVELLNTPTPHDFHPGLRPSCWVAPRHKPNGGAMDEHPQRQRGHVEENLRSDNHLERAAHLKAWERVKLLTV